MVQHLIDHRLDLRENPVDHDGVALRVHMCAQECGWRNVLKESAEKYCAVTRSSVLTYEKLPISEHQDLNAAPSQFFDYRIDIGGRLTRIDYHAALAPAAELIVTARLQNHNLRALRRVAGSPPYVLCCVAAVPRILDRDIVAGRSQCGLQLGRICLAA